VQRKTIQTLENLRGPSEVAKLLRMDRKTVIRIANRCHVGLSVAGRSLFSDSDVEIIRQNYHGGPGNPNFKKSS
jgi:hypothetical protein